MYIGEQIINPTEDRLRLSAQLGVSHVVIDSRPNTRFNGPDGNWDAGSVADFRRSVEAQGVALECLALDLGSFLLDTKYDAGRAAARAAKMRADIRAAAKAGMTMLKYNVQMVGITRTGRRLGRGGVLESAFRAAAYSPERDAAHSYWGVGHPGGGEGADIAVNASGTAEAVGQVVATEIAGMSADDCWTALTGFVEEVIPTAEVMGILCPDHVPASDLDPARERFFAFALGYTRGLLQAA